MIFILLLAMYAFAAGRVVVMPGVTISGPRARVFGFAILLLIFPARWLLNALVISTLPRGWLDDRVHFAIVNVVFLIAYVLGLALLLRDREPAPA